MDRLGFFKQGLSSAADVVGSIVGLKKAVNTFSEAVDEALSNVSSDIGLNLLSLQSDMIENAGNTLCDIAGMGYTMIETASFAGGKVHDMKPDAFKALADRAGLKIAGAHINRLREEFDAPASAPRPETAEAADANAAAGPAMPAEDPAMAWWNEALDIHRGLGCRYVTMSRLPENIAGDTAEIYAAYFNAIGALAAQKGMKFCFHPHRSHLAAKDGVSVFDSIAAATDPGKVWFEIDTYEAAEAGIDTVALLKRYRRRIPVLHLHDYGVACESGRIDFDTVVTEAVKCGAQDIFVEVRDYMLPPKNCVERSLYNLESLPSIRY